MRYSGANGFVYCGCFCFLGGDALRFVVLRCVWVDGCFKICLCLVWWVWL